MPGQRLVEFWSVYLTNQEWGWMDFTCDQSNQPPQRLLSGFVCRVKVHLCIVMVLVADFCMHERLLFVRLTPIKVLCA